MPEYTFPNETVQKRRTTDFSPVGDLYAPFFDVAFYAPISPEGRAQITQLENQAAALEQIPLGLGAPSASAFRNAASALAGVPVTDIADTSTIGAGRVQMRSVGGGLQSYDPAGPDSPVANLANFRGQLQISMLSAAALQATLTLTPPYEDAIRIVDNELIKFGSIMEIQWGYLDLKGGKPAISDKGLFTITQPAISFGRDVTITIGGFDLLSTSMRSVDTRCHWLREDNPCDLDIMKKLIKKRAPTLAIDAEELSDKSSARRRKTRPVVQADDDWTFFRRLCRQNRVHFEPKGDVIFLKDRTQLDAAPRKYRLTWFMQPEGAFDIPMKTFQTNPHFGYFAMQGSRGQRTFCRDADTGEIQQVDRSPARANGANIGANRSGATPDGHTQDATQTTQGKVSPFGPMDESCASGRVYLQPCKRANQREEIDGENDELRQNANTKATVTCPGVPGLVPQQIVTVVNVGKKFSGNYRVMKVVHTIGKGYEMHIDLLRTASTNDKQGNVPAVTGRENIADKKPPVGEAVTPRRGDDAPTILNSGENDSRNTGCVNEEATKAVREALAIHRQAIAQAQAAIIASLNPFGN